MSRGSKRDLGIRVGRWSCLAVADRGFCGTWEETCWKLGGRGREEMELELKLVPECVRNRARTTLTRNRGSSTGPGESGNEGRPGRERTRQKAGRYGSRGGECVKLYVMSSKEVSEVPGWISRSSSSPLSWDNGANNAWRLQTRRLHH